MTETIRPIDSRTGARGEPCWPSMASTPDNSLAQCTIKPDKVIPVIFVPGIMGSNLQSTKDKKPVWLLNSLLSPMGWLFKGEKTRYKLLSPDTTEVFNAGATEDHPVLTKEERQARGWGEVSNMSYGKYLVELDVMLNDFSSANTNSDKRKLLIDLALHDNDNVLTEDEVAASWRYAMPVHACGYNWLQSNKDSGIRLAQLIDKVIKLYSNKRHCDQVILITHSMGGLVVRSALATSNIESKVVGVIHGVMPDIGAPAVYCRMKAGTEVRGSWLEGLASKATSEIMGGDAAEMTAVMGNSPGALQLLPTAEYGMGWLKVESPEGAINLPHSDPYEDIYLQSEPWWALCEKQLINPNITSDAPEKANEAFSVFSEMLMDKVYALHNEIKSVYHPQTFAFFGASQKEEHTAFGNITWKHIGSKVELNRLEPNQRQNTRRELGRNRTINGKDGKEHRYQLSMPDAPGDGTVPVISGSAPSRKAKLLDSMEVIAGHEPAFKDCLAAQQFTLRAITKLAHLKG